MSHFELDPAAVSRVEQLLYDTGVLINREASQASDQVTGLIGTAWKGVAGGVASAKQNDEFRPAMTRLHRELNRISENLGLGRRNVLSEDDAIGQTLQTVTPDAGNFTRL